jgi:phosphoglycolate phosphatase
LDASGESAFLNLLDAAEGALIRAAASTQPIGAYPLRVGLWKSVVRYKVIIFDFDGTLADSFPWYCRVINDVAEKYRFRRIAENELETVRGYDARTMIAHVGLPMWKLPLVQRHMRKRMTREIEQISLFPGIDQLLRRLNAEGVILAIVTSNSSANVHQVLGPQNVALIQYYACDASIFGKRAKLRKILRASGVRPDEAIFIGDEIRDLNEARAEDIPFGAVSWGFNSMESLRRNSPDELFASIDDILVQLTRHERH